MCNYYVLRAERLTAAIIMFGPAEREKCDEYIKKDIDNQAKIREASELYMDRVKLKYTLVKEKDVIELEL